MEKIRKPTGIITSLGRTGTKFFAGVMRKVSSDITSLHEPDVFHLSYRLGHTIADLISQIRAVGTDNLILKKLAGKWALIDLSDLRFYDQLSREETVRRFHKYRRNFIESRPGKVYIESNIGYYGLIDIVKDAFKYQRVAYIVRDGRDWVTSNMNWGEMFNKGLIRGTLGHSWPTAEKVNGDMYSHQWKDMDRFEKLCWAWARLNTYALETLSSNPEARVFVFEDIFYSQHKYAYLRELINFLLDFRESPPVELNSIMGALEEKVHASSGTFSNWENWGDERIQSFNKICGELMERLDYY